MIPKKPSSSSRLSKPQTPTPRSKPAKQSERSAKSSAATRGEALESKLSKLNFKNQSSLDENQSSTISEASTVFTPTTATTTSPTPSPAPSLANYTQEPTKTELKKLRAGWMDKTILDVGHLYNYMNAPSSSYEERLWVCQQLIHVGSEAWKDATQDIEKCPGGDYYHVNPRDYQKEISERVNQAQGTNKQNEQA